MLQDKFLEISKSLNGQYSSQTNLYQGNQWSSLPVTVHQFEFSYKGILIKFNYELGNSNVAEISCAFIPFKLIPEFDIAKKGHFQLLFSRNKNAWSVHCSNKMFVNKIKMILYSSGIEELSKVTAFEPKISGRLFEKEYKIFTQYYLGFDKFEDSILPIIDFYKKLIDAIN